MKMIFMLLFLVSCGCPDREPSDSIIIRVPEDEPIDEDECYNEEDEQYEVIYRSQL